MAPIDVPCGEPPPVTSFHVADLGDTYAILQWASDSIRPKYAFELVYNSLDNPYESIIMHLPNSQSLVLLKELRSGTNYTSQIVSLNDCAKSHSKEVIFETKTTVLHPAVSHVMPHEVIMTLIVLFIWLIILRQFFIVYNRLAFVSGASLGGYLTRKHSRTLTADRSMSTQTLLSKMSVKPSFTVLENAVCHWRSETVLAARRNSEMTSPVTLRAHVSSGQMSMNVHKKTSRNSYSGPLIFLTSSNSPPPELQHAFKSNHLTYAATAGSVQSCPGPVPFTSTTEASSHLTAFEPLLDCEDAVSPEPMSTMKLPTSLEVRKISQVLLGKATDDIRRTRQDEPDKKMQRRRSLLESISDFSGSIKKKSRKWRKYNMESLKEEKEGSSTPAETSNCGSSRGGKDSARNREKTAVRKLLSKTYIGTSLDSQKTHNYSPDSFVTASDYDFDDKSVDD